MQFTNEPVRAWGSNERVLRLISLVGTDLQTSFFTEAFEEAAMNAAVAILRPDLQPDWPEWQWELGIVEDAFERFTRGHGTKGIVEPVADLFRNTWAIVCAARAERDVLACCIQKGYSGDASFMIGPSYAFQARDKHTLRLGCRVNHSHPYEHFASGGTTEEQLRESSDEEADERDRLLELHDRMSKARERNASALLRRHGLDSPRTDEASNVYQWAWVRETHVEVASTIAPHWTVRERLQEVLVRHAKAKMVSFAMDGLMSRDVQ